MTIPELDEMQENIARRHPVEQITNKSAVRCASSLALVEIAKQLVILKEIAQRALAPPPLPAYLRTPCPPPYRGVYAGAGGHSNLGRTAEGETP